MPRYFWSVAAASSLAIAAVAKPPETSPVAAASAPGSPAEKPPTIEQTLISRSLGGPPSREVVTAVAELARPTRFSPTQLPGLGQLTARQLVEQTCGSVQEGYVEALARANPSRPIELDQALGDGGYDLIWPACLFAGHVAGTALTYQIQPRDNPMFIRQLFTGATGTPSEANAFVEAGAGEPLSAYALPVGRPLEIPFVTRPTRLYVRAGTAPQLVQRLVAIGAGNIAAEEAGSDGEIFLPPDAGLGKFASENETRCLGEDGPSSTGVVASQETTAAYPFDPAAVAAAYRHSLESWQELGFLPQTIHLVVVDNGFFGLPCLPGNCPQSEAGIPQFSNRFPRRYFDAPQFGIGQLGPTTPPSSFPNNYANGLNRADPISGHGTHVAGLALGGPSFLPYRSVFETGGATWVKLVIANLAPGRRTFPVGIETTIMSQIAAIRGRRIVNLSLVIDGSARRAASDTVRQLITGNADSLFVVAAGNHRQNLDARPYYPARLGGGGQGAPNVMTVASVDRTGVLSDFSNWSGRYVDIVAPGCRLLSWLDAESEPVPESGTSQAAPLVSFGAALLASISDASPQRLKARLMYSGKLLDDPAQRSRVVGGTQLDLFQALLMRDDVLTFEEGDVLRTVVGRIDAPLQALGCEGEAEDREFGQILALKRADDAVYLFLRVDRGEPVQRCPARIAVNIGDNPNRLEMTITHELRGSELQALPQPIAIAPPVTSIRDLVRRDP